MSKLIEAVRAMQAQRATCSAKFAETTSAINVELDAVGGCATTSPEYKNGSKR